MNRLILSFLLFACLRAGAQMDDRPPVRAFAELTYSHYYTDTGLTFVSLPGYAAATDFGSERIFLRLMALDILFKKDFRFVDALFGGGIGIAPFKKVWMLNVDYSFSYGLCGWNNFSGLLKPNMSLCIPFHKKDKAGLKLVLAAGVYYRYSYKLFGYLGSNEYYRNAKGFYFQVGLGLGN
ncbi:MAG: hypothetical protein AB1458_08855 [Bacteroidota bacterium]